MGNQNNENKEAPKKEKQPTFSFDAIVGIKSLSSAERYYAERKILSIELEREISEWEVEFKKIGLEK